MANKKQQIETIKTVAIAVLVSGIIAFGGGVQYQKSVQDDVDVVVENNVGLEDDQPSK